MSINQWFDFNTNKWIEAFTPAEAVAVNFLQYLNLQKGESPFYGNFGYWAIEVCQGRYPLDASAMDAKAAFMSNPFIVNINYTIEPIVDSNNSTGIVNFELTFTEPVFSSTTFTTSFNTANVN